MPLKRKTPVGSKCYQVDTVVRELYKKKGFKASTSDSSFEETIQTYDYPSPAKPPKLVQLAQLETERRRFAAKNNGSFQSAITALLPQRKPPCSKQISECVAKKTKNELAKAKFLSVDKVVPKKPNRNQNSAGSSKPKKANVQKLKVTKPILQKTQRASINTLYVNSKVPCNVPSARGPKAPPPKSEPKIYKRAYDIARMTKEAMEYFKPPVETSKIIKPELTELFRNHSTAASVNNYKDDGYTKMVTEEFERMIRLKL